MAIIPGVGLTKKIADPLIKGVGKAVGSVTPAILQGVGAVVNKNTAASGAAKAATNTVKNNSKNTAVNAAVNSALKGIGTSSGGTQKGSSTSGSGSTNISTGVPSQFQQSQAVTEAMAYTNGLLQQLSTGRTSYSDQIDGLIQELMNREKFSYDMESDPLFQQALAGAMASGKTAMQDTIGQAASLTGGYGNTYGTTAANNAYNQYIQEAYGEVPAYYQLALEAYNMEGQKMLNQLDALGAADTKEYERLYNAYAANSQAATEAYNKEYNEWADAMNAALSVSASGSGGGETEYKTPSENQFQKALDAYNTGGEDALRQYIFTLPDNVDTEQIGMYVQQYGNYVLPMEQRTYTKTKDTINWFGGIDDNDVVTDNYENAYKLASLLEQLPEEVIKELTELKKGKSYTVK